MADLGSNSATLIIRSDSPPDALKWAAEKGAALADGLIKQLEGLDDQQRSAGR